MEEILFSLIRSEICGTAVPEDIKAACNADRLQQVYLLAKRHSVEHIAGQTLGKLKLLGTDALSEKIRESTMHAYFRQMQMETEFGRICEALETARLTFLPLKGAVLRHFYPEPWLRTSCDIDILVKPEMLDAAVAVLEKTLNYTNRGRRDHDVSLLSSSGVHLELHFDILEDWYAAGNAKAVLARVWEEATLETGWSFRYRMSDALFYFYHIAHMAKHFQAGGCGVRSFLDVWVLNHRVSYDKEKRAQLLLEGGLSNFAAAAEKLAQVWFSEQTHDALSRQISDYILRAGTFGNQENRAAVGQVQAGGKVKYLLFRRVFLPYEILKAEYPVLKKHKWLMPVYQIVRWVRMLRQGKLGMATREWKTNMETATEDSVAHMLKELGL